MKFTRKVLLICGVLAGLAQAVQSSAAVERRAGGLGVVDGCEIIYPDISEIYCAAVEGDRRAQYGVGMYLLYRPMRAEDNAAAAQWFRLAATRRAEGCCDIRAAAGLPEKNLRTNRPHPRAAYELGKLYLAGRGGVAKSPRKARRYLKIAARRRHSEAAYMLGLIYLSGQDSRKSLRKVKKYLKKAANMGHIEAKKRLEGLEADDQ